jgi:putative ABC transport system permease protein
MKGLRAWVLRLGGIFPSQRRERELADEIESHLQMHIEDNLRCGMTPERARREAILKLGGIEPTKQACRDRSTLPFIETLMQDLRFAIRHLRKNPGFASTSTLILALGIGASGAIFSVLNPILFQPLPYPQASRVMMIWYRAPDGSRVAETFGTYRELVERSRSFDAIAVMKPWQPTMTGADEPERFDGQSVSAGYFRVLGVSPVQGRDFHTSDDRLNGPKEVIVSDKLWRRRFSGDRTIVGRQVMLEGNVYTVIGVMPSSFENVLAPSADIWSPLQYDMSQEFAWGHHLRMVGRVRPDVGMDQARRELDTIAHTTVAEFPRMSWASLKQGFVVNLLQEEVTGAIKPALFAVLAAVILVLLIACVNVTNLLLASGARRRGEFAMRAALGAGRRRLMRQLLTESLLLAAIGGLLGILGAQFGVRALVALSPPSLPRLGAIGLDRNVFAFALGITTLVGLVVGIMPALRASRNDPQSALQQSSARAAGGHQRTRQMLVVAEIALALVLLVSTGLLLRSFDRLFAVDPGFDASNLLTMQVDTSGRRFDKNTTDRFFAQMLEAVRNTAGVTSSSFTSQLPMSGDDDEYGARFEGDDAKVGYNVFRYAVSPDYLETIHIPLRRGRLLDARDVAGAPLAVLISESLANRKFAGREPVGQRVHLGPTDRPSYTIVGVVGDVKQMSLAESQPDAVYITTTQSWFVDGALSLVVRAPGDTASLTPAVRKAIWSVDKDQAIVRVATMNELLAASAAERRFALIVFEAFALVALALAAAGIYGVLAGGVAERTREIGVRAALGASRGSLVALVVRQGMMLTGIGVAIGLAGAVAASEAISAMLFDVSRFDPITYLGVIVLLLGASGFACWVPAWRVARVDPSITLRAE